MPYFTFSLVVFDAQLRGYNNYVIMIDNLFLY